MLRIRVTFVIVAFALTSVAKASVVVNGNFETGNIDGWTWAPSMLTEQDIVSYDVYGNDGNSLAFRVDPTDSAGGSNSHLTQLLNLTAGVEYNVSWEQAMQNTGPSSILETGELRVSLGSQLLIHWSQGVLGAGTTTELHEVKTFVPATTQPYELHFQFTRSSPNYGDSTVYMYIDNVSVVPVPEPSAAILLIAGALCGFRAVRWTG